MLTPHNEPHIKKSKPFAPKRLARRDVAAIRGLRHDAWDAHDAGRHKGYEAKLVIFLTRRERERTVGRLGRNMPRVVIHARWSQMKKHGPWGLDVQVWAHAVAGSDVRELQVGTHRFRTDSRLTQFCREVSHLARLGLGWSARFSRSRWM